MARGNGEGLGQGWIENISQKPYRKYVILNGVRQDYFIDYPEDNLGSMVVTNLYTGEQVGRGIRSVPEEAILEKNGPHPSEL